MEKIDTTELNDYKLFKKMIYIISPVINNVTDYYKNYSLESFRKNYNLGYDKAKEFLKLYNEDK